MNGAERQYRFPGVVCRAGWMYLLLAAPGFLATFQNGVTIPTRTIGRSTGVWAAEPVRKVAETRRARGSSEHDLAKIPRTRRPVAGGLVGDQLWIGHQRTGTVTAVDLNRLEVVREFPVADSIANLLVHEFEQDRQELLVLDPERHVLRQWLITGDELLERSAIQLPHSPIRLALSGDRRRLAVSSLWSRRVTILAREAEPAATVTGEPAGEGSSRGAWTTWREWELPFASRELLWDDSSRWLLVADGYRGRLAVLDMETRHIHRVHEMTGHHLHGLANRHDGRAVRMTLQRLNPFRETTHEEVFWGRVIKNVMVEVTWDRLVDVDRPPLGAGEEPETLPLYFLGGPQEGAGDPGAVLAYGDQATLVAFSGIHQVAIRHADDAPFTRREVGRRPVALIPDPARGRVYVINQMDDSVSVLDVERAEPIRTISLGPSRKPDLVDQGESLFYDATLSLDGWYSCHSCHTDGHTIGLLNDNFGDDTFGAPKRILSLRGVGETGPWAWHGRVAELSEQVEKSIRDTMQGAAVNEEAVSALTEFIRQLPPPPAGHVLRPLDPELQARGAELFATRACADCHAAPTYTTPQAYDVGIHDEVGRATFNPPSLRGVAHRERLFHDNRAASLREVFTARHHPDDTGWTEAEADAIVEFLLGL